MKKNTLCNTEKYKNQAGMNLTPPAPYYYYTIITTCKLDLGRLSARGLVSFSLVLGMQDMIAVYAM